MGEILIISLCISFFLLVWFKSEAFVEYSKLFGLTKLFKVDEYEKLEKKPHYMEYLRGQSNSFFIKLITCEYCLTTWLALLSTFLNFGLLPLLPLIQIWFCVAALSIGFFFLIVKFSRPY